MKKFFVLLGSQGVSIIGSIVVEFALAWYLKEITGSAIVLTTAVLTAFLPRVFLAPFVGPFIDRWDRKKIMILADLSVMLLTVVLVVLFIADIAEVWHVYVVMFGRSIGQVFQQPAFTSSIPMIVSKENLVRANGLGGTLRGLTILIGPPVGAFLMKTLPMAWVLSVDIITALIAIGCLLPLGIPRPEQTTLSAEKSVIKDMAQGIRYVISWKALRYVVILCALLSLFSVPLQTLLPLFVEKYFNNDVLKLGWIQMALGIGGISGGLILAAWGGFKKRIMTSFAGLMFAYIPFIVVGFTNDKLFLLALCMVALIGFGNIFFNGPINAIIQANVPKDMQGRVFTVLGSISTAAIPIGLAIAGPVAETVELRWVYVGSALLSLTSAIILFSFGNIFSIEETKPIDETS